MPDHDALTPRQQRFVEEYLIDLNATDAYRRAGYRCTSEDSACAAASRLLATVKVAAAVRKAMEKRSGRVEITQDYILQRLYQNVERSMQIEPVLGRKGQETGQYTYQGSVANRALELLGKHKGMFPDRQSDGDDKDRPPTVIIYLPEHVRPVIAAVPPVMLPDRQPATTNGTNGTNGSH